MSALEDSGYYSGTEHNKSLIDKGDAERDCEFRPLKNTYSNEQGFNLWHRELLPCQRVPQAQWHSYDKNTVGVVNNTLKYSQYMSTKT